MVFPNVAGIEDAPLNVEPTLPDNTYTFDVHGLVADLPVLGAYLNYGVRELRWDVSHLTLLLYNQI